MSDTESGDIQYWSSKSTQLEMELLKCLETSVNRQAKLDRQEERRQIGEDNYSVLNDRFVEVEAERDRLQVQVDGLRKRLGDVEAEHEVVHLDEYNEVNTDLQSCITEMDRLRGERDQLRARVAWLEKP